MPLHCVDVHSEQRTMDEFTDEEIEKLIDLVSKQCDLYDPNSRKFKSLHRRQAIWNDIGNSLNKDGKFNLYYIIAFIITFTDVIYCYIHNNIHIISGL